MKIIAKQWEDFVAKVELSGAPPIQVSEMRRAFYAGALALLHTVMGALSEEAEPTEADLAVMYAIHKELDEFTKDVAEGRK